MQFQSEQKTLNCYWDATVQQKSFQWLESLPAVRSAAFSAGPGVTGQRKVCFRHQNGRKETQGKWGIKPHHEAEHYQIGFLSCSTFGSLQAGLTRP